MFVTFQRIQLGAHFKQCETEFIKTSTRTARVKNSPHKVFYFGKDELIPFNSVKTLEEL